MNIVMNRARQSFITIVYANIRYKPHHVSQKHKLTTHCIPIPLLMSGLDVKGLKINSNSANKLTGTILRMTPALQRAKQDYHHFGRRTNTRVITCPAKLIDLQSLWNIESLMEDLTVSSSISVFPNEENSTFQDFRAPSSKRPVITSTCLHECHWSFHLPTTDAYSKTDSGHISGEIGLDA
jgi:hypothetical protein